MKTSRFIAWALRHAAPELGLELDSQGWADITELCRCADDHGIPLAEEDVREIAETDQKHRFIISSDRASIRALWGHSLEVDSKDLLQSPPPVLYHVIAARSLESVMSDGLVPRGHRVLSFSPSLATAERASRRRGRPVTLEVDAQAIHQEGRRFFSVGAGTWIFHEKIPAEYLRVIDHGSEAENTAV